MANKSSLRVVLYARFSSDNQRSESIDAQIRAMKKFCKDNNYRIVETYIDEAKSATSDKRPAFQSMIEDSAKQYFDVVLVHKLDRFSRNRYDSAMYKRELKKNGVRVYSVLENLDDSPESIMMEAMLEGMSEYYSKNLSREVMKGMFESARKCTHLGGLPPLGYDVGADKRLVINEREAEAVKIIFTRYDLGYGYDHIIRELNRNGFKTKVGNPFGKNSIHDILINEKYCGIYVFNRSASKDMFDRRNTHASKEDEQIIRIPGGCPRIIEKDMFERVQAKMLENKKRCGAYKAKEIYLFSGLMKCGICGRSMYGNARFSGRNKTKHVTYRCPNKKHYCHNKEINKAYIEEFVVMELRRILLDRGKLTDLIDKVNSYVDKQQKSSKDQINLYKEKFDAINASIDNITKAIEKGLMNDSFFARLNELENERVVLECQMAKESAISSSRYNINDADGMLEKFEACLENSVSNECKVLINDFIKDVIIYPDKVTITLNTGFNIANTLNKVLTVSREKIYKMAG